MPNAAAVIGVVRRYVRAALPIPVRSELSFWVCSCLPSSKLEPGERGLVRINLNWQVVFSVSDYDGELEASFNLAQSPLQAAFGESMDFLPQAFPTLQETDDVFEPGGHDQMHLKVLGLGEVARFLEQKAVIATIRLFNLRLMKKGASVYGRYHCLDLADKLLSVE